MTTTKIIEIAANEIGVCENPPNNNNVKYNTWYYGKEVSGAGYPWCAVFISWCFRTEQALCKKTASCVDMLDWFEKRGQIVKTPMPGDIVFFKYSTNNRRTNHVGLVIGVDGKIITTIEGNTSTTSQDNGGKVMRRNRYSNIVAYARPKYSDNTTVNAEKKTVEEVAKEVIDGKWGNGVVRRQRLTQAGYNYVEVQKEVNKLLTR